MNATSTTPTIRIPGNGRAFHLFDMFVVCKISGDDTGGAYSVFEQTLPAGGVVPAHTIHEHEVALHLLEGTLMIRVGGQIIQAEAGTHVRIPAHTVFGYENCKNIPARFVFMVSPAGLEDLFEELDMLDQADHVERIEAIRLLAKHGVDVPGLTDHSLQHLPPIEFNDLSTPKELQANTVIW